MNSHSGSRAVRRGVATLAGFGVAVSSVGLFSDVASAKTTKLRTTSKRTTRTIPPTTTRPRTTAPTTNTPAGPIANAFSAQLYNELASVAPTDNFVVSGYSVAEALSLLRLGTAGTSSAQLDNALGEGRSIDHEKRRALRIQLTAPSKDGSTKIANSIWVGKTYTLTPSFTRDAEQYAAKSQSIDFAKPDEAAATINRWVASATDNNIKELVEPAAFTEDTAAVLANAVHFKGAWSSAFEPGSTALATFDVNGKRIQTPTMIGKQDIVLAADGTLVRMQYNDGAYAMELFVPRASSPSSLRASASSLHAGSADGALCKKVQVAVPKWTTKSSFKELPSALKKLGIVDIFNARSANIPNVASGNNLLVSKVMQEAKIEVDENGTLASAATAVILAPTSAAPLPPGDCPTSFLVDRPFVYVIRHVPTNTVLFAGQVIDPSKTA